MPGIEQSNVPSTTTNRVEAPAARRGNNEGPTRLAMLWPANQVATVTALYGSYQMSQQARACLEQNPDASAIGCLQEALLQPQVLFPLAIGLGGILMVGCSAIYLSYTAKK